MDCEIFFEINGSDEEQLLVAAKIATFLTRLDRLGDIARLDGNPEELQSLLVSENLV